MVRRRLLLITQIYRPDPAAAGQYLTDVAEEMARRGMDVTVIAADRGYDDPSIHYPHRETIAGVSIIRVPFSSFGKQSIAGRAIGGLLFVLQGAVRALFMRRFDLMLVSTVPPMAPLAALILHALRRIPIVYWVMDVNPDQIVALGYLKPDNFAVHLMNWMNRSTLSVARGVVVLDSYMEARMRHKFDAPLNVRIIPPWSRDAYLEPVPHAANPFRDRHEFGDRFVVMYSGNHGPSAPLDTLFKAAERLRGDSRFVFVFAGGGVGKPRVDDLAAANPNVLSLPYQPLEELRYSLSAADVHVVSTGNEMVGIVHQCKIYGSFAVARPVVFLGPEASALGAILSDHQVGWHVDHGNVDELVTLLLRLIQQRETQVAVRGVNAKELSTHLYSMEGLRTELCDFVEENLEEPGPHAHPSASSTVGPVAAPLLPPAPAGLKIIYVIARLNVGGPAQHVIWLDAELKADGHEVLLVTGNVAAGEADMFDFAADRNVTPLVIPEMSRELSARDAITLWKLWRLMVRENPDVIHTHTAKAGAVGRMAAFLYRWCTPGILIGRRRQCVVVHTYHGHVFHGYFGRARTWIFLTIERVLARLVTDRIVVLSPQQLEEIHGTFHVGRRHQFAIVPLGLDLRPFADTESRRRIYRAEIGATDDDTLIGIVGRLTEIKNHDLFLRAAARIIARRRERPPRIRFIVIGDGHLRPSLERLTQELDIARDVRFEGTRDDPEVFTPGLDLLVLTSKNEGTPQCVIEGIASRRPVLSTAVGGVGDLLGAPAPDWSPAPGTYEVVDRGVLVPSEDVDALTNAMSRLIDDHALRQSIADRMATHGVGTWSIERLVRDLKQIYSTAV